MSSLTHQPEYFARVAARARATCQRLEDDPDLAGPWNLLFEQIQNPRFVISELLQNADDAGATNAEVSVNDSVFVFSHNGHDFNEEQFASLCRFGFSNKRTIHTIGFRGIGFKSTFSLGHTVEVWTPTLAVAFSDKRFIEPRWIHDGRTISNTQIKVHFDRVGVLNDVRASLENWQQSPASLLFFNNIRKLTLNGQAIERSESKTRVPHTFAVELSGTTTQSLHLLRSDEVVFPPEVIEEIREARGLKDISDLHLGGCKVEVVLGLSGDQHLFVVLPTGEPLSLPFSINAPFILKPDRFDIKPPSISPTNAWLLKRAGELVADVAHAWLSNESLSIPKRAEAYRLLPNQGGSDSSTSASIKETIIKRLSNRAVVLNCYEKLSEIGATSVPAQLFEIWSSKQVRTLLCPETQLVSPEINAAARLTLAKLGWIRVLAPEDVLRFFAERRTLPKPDTWAKLALLWSFALEHAPKYDYENERKRAYPIVPVVEHAELRPASSVVRVSSRTDALSPDTIAWLTGRTPVLDPLWVDWLAKQEGKSRESLVALLRALQLHEPTSANRLVEQTAKSVFARTTVTIEECVELAQLFAALGASTPKGFQFISGDRLRRTNEYGVVYDVDGRIADLAPESWIESHVLHEQYDKFVRCTHDDWLRWVRTPASGLRTCFPLLAKGDIFESKSELLNFLKSRNSSAPESYHYRSENFSIRDFGFDAELTNYWNEISSHDPAVWQKVLDLILSETHQHWKNALAATVFHDGRDYRRQLTCPPITPEWICLFRDKPCLLDTDRVPRLPGELYRRTGDTDPLQSSREFKFVEIESDTEVTRPVLRSLGVLDTPADYNKIIQRLDALRSAPVSSTIISAISTLYHVLDRVVTRCRPVERAEIEAAFSKSPLILAADQTWQTAGELSVYPGDEESPDPASFIDPAFQPFAMWTRIGVSQHPSVGQNLEWLKSLGSGQPLDSSAHKRVLRAIARDSLRVWQECGHWLSLDLTWEPTSRFTHRLTMQSLTQYERLMPGVKRSVADMRRVPSLFLSQDPFSALPDLAGALEIRVTHFSGIEGVRENPRWLKLLADTFRRANFADPHRQDQVRLSGARLHRSRWLAVGFLEVTPYLAQVPAGSALPAKAAWVGEDLYVLSGSAGRIHGALVEELSRPFGLADVTRAFDSCAGRDEAFIADYIAEHFCLEATIELLPDRSDACVESTPTDVFGTTTDETADSSKSLVLGSKEESSLEPPSKSQDDGAHTQPTVNKPRSAPEPSIFDRYAASLGFKSVGNGYAHSDGRQIVKSSAPFHWELLDQRGICTRRYWACRDSIQKGVVVAAEIWTLTHQSPNTITWILASETTEFTAVAGNELTSKMDHSQWKLYPSSYRLVTNKSNA